jgi:F0F1-type ATP synthase membrane subunit c/vacuolar-type H+-ATPase subunit K
MVNSAERRRLESAYAAPVYPRAVLLMCAAGLLVVLAVSIAAGVVGGTDANVIAGVSERPAANGR